MKPKLTRGHRMARCTALGRCSPVRFQSNRLHFEQLESRQMLSTVFALTANDILLQFDSERTGTIENTVQVTGLKPGERLLAIDIRPATGELVAQGSSDRLYSVNTVTGRATAIGQAPFLLLPALSNGDFGIDISPVKADEARIVSNADHNFRLNVRNGSLISRDPPLAYAPLDANAGLNPNVVAIGYTNNSAGAAFTTLLGIDSDRDTLVSIGGPGGSPSPNSGQLFTIGALGVDTSGFTGLDVQTGTGVVFAVLTAPGGTSSSLYTVNTATGQATLKGTVGSNSPIIRAIAVALSDGTPGQEFIGQSYRDLLHHEADPDSTRFWTSFLNGGGTRAAVAERLQGTIDRRLVQVEEGYQQFLGRAPEPQGLAFWSDVLSRGTPPDQFRAALAGSDEYFAKSGRTNDGFLNLLFQDSLGRSIEPGGRAFFTAQLNSGVTREQVARNVLGSQEADLVLVRTWYLDFLRRSADTGGENFFVNLLQQGQREEIVVATIVGSDEYFANL